MSGTNKSPQQRAAEVSARNRARRAQERRDREERRAEYPREHERGKHKGRPLVGCPLCVDAVREAMRDVQ